MKNFLTRSASAVVYAGILVAGSLWWSPLLYAALAFFMVIGLIELKKLLKPEMNQGIFVFWAAICILALSTMISAFNDKLLNDDGWLIILSLFLPVLLSFPLIALSTFSKKTSTGQFAFFAISLIYIAIPILFMVGLQTYEFSGNISWLLVLLAIIWINDTMAYITGSLIGRKKLIERISPGKTWEGFFGGMFFSLAVALIVNYLFFDYDIDTLTIVTIVIVLSGTLGDLLESKLKREAGVKDSGNIIPGHGGILDRIDSLLVAAPFTGLTLLFINALTHWF